MRKLGGLPWQREHQESQHSPKAVPTTQDSEESGLPGPDREANLLGQKII